MMDIITTSLVRNKINWTLSFNEFNPPGSDTPISVSDLLLLFDEKQASSLVIDMSHLENIDSSGLRYLLDLRDGLIQANRKVILRNPNPYLRRLLRIMQFEPLFVIELLYH
ncbi:MAG: STAS domain-containing protein [Anaerolineae bacterium]|nr:STAS domain-containing protein [Anaerolineae bacterium]